MENKINIKKFIGKKRWLKNWSGHWSLLSCTIFGREYTVLLKKFLSVGISNCLFIEKQGESAAYYSDSILEEFAGGLTRKAEADPILIDDWCRDIKKHTDEVLCLIKETEKREIDRGDYKRYLVAMDAYSVSHRAIKMTVDFLSPSLLKNKLKKMQAARLYAESVYTVSEIFLEKWAKQVERKNKISYKLVLCCTKDEVDIFWKTGKLPSKKELEKRFKLCVIFFEKGKYQLSVNKEAVMAEKMVHNSFFEDKELKGTCAYPGKVTGRVKIVFDPSKIKDFKEGDILVTPMTRPEYLNLVKKSAGFITDAGGMLSHAAITARELKKPCVVGTQVSTKKLKDGDVVEVDAGKGVINILR